ncbi:HIT family protein [Actinoplanes solisilvae]|uniref:HIT family protein n=1 Tax=Actinoplanes solisilvae TaxID=2486853 RepID=UPI000FD9EF07|nr:HIT family protein [Actinoplanes solisilvae]
MATLFTKIINGDIPGRFVWTDDRVAAFLTIAPLTAGHTLVVPRDEVDDWTQLPADLLGHVMTVSHTIGGALKKAYGSPRVGLIVAGFEVPHTHVHVFPAWEMDDFDFARADANVPAERFDEDQKKILAALGR